MAFKEPKDVVASKELSRKQNIEKRGDNRPEGPHCSENGISMSLCLAFR